MFKKKLLIFWIDLLLQGLAVFGAYKLFYFIKVAQGDEVVNVVDVVGARRYWYMLFYLLFMLTVSISIFQLVYIIRYLIKKESAFVKARFIQLVIFLVMFGGIIALILTIPERIPLISQLPLTAYGVLLIFIVNILFYWRQWRKEFLWYMNGKQQPESWLQELHD